MGGMATEIGMECVWCGVERDGGGGCRKGAQFNHTINIACICNMCVCVCARMMMMMTMMMINANANLPWTNLFSQIHVDK